MYLPPAYREDDVDTLVAFMRAHSFISLVSVLDGVPVASHIPIVVDATAGQVTLSGHLAKANPQWRAFDGRDSLAIYQKAGREDLAQQEAAEIAVIEEFLPKQLGEADVRAVIAAVIQDVGATGPRDMGKVMAALKARHAGEMDFGKVSALVKALLAAT